MKQGHLLKTKARVALWVAGLLVIIFFLNGILFVVDRMFGEYVCEYDVRVTYVSYRFGGTAYFTNKHGEESRVDLSDYWIIRSDEDGFIEIGDLVKVKECVGLFGGRYYRLHKEV